MQPILDEKWEMPVVLFASLFVTLAFCLMAKPKMQGWKVLVHICVWPVVATVAAVPFLWVLSAGLH